MRLKKKPFGVATEVTLGLKRQTGRPTHKLKPLNLHHSCIWLATAKGEIYSLQICKIPYNEIERHEYGADTMRRWLRGDSTFTDVSISRIYKLARKKINKL